MTVEKKCTGITYRNFGYKLIINSPFENIIDRFNNADAFPDLDLVVKSMKESFKVHRATLAAASPIMKNLINTRTRILPCGMRELVWNPKVDRDVDKQSFIKALRFCYGEALSIGTKDGECCAMISVLYQLQLEHLNEIVSAIRDFAVVQAMKNLSFGVELLKCCTRYNDCCSRYCELNKELAKVVFSKNNVHDHYGEVVNGCLLELPIEYLNMVEYGEPHTPYSEFSVKMKYYRKYSIHLNEAERQVLLSKCDWGKLNSQELRELRMARVLSTDKLLLEYERAMENCERERDNGVKEAEKIKAYLNKLREEAEKERDSEKEKVAQKEKEKTELEGKVMQLEKELAAEKEKAQEAEKEKNKEAEHTEKVDQENEKIEKQQEKPEVKHSSFKDRAKRAEKERDALKKTVTQLEKALAEEREKRKQGEEKQEQAKGAESSSQLEELQRERKSYKRSAKKSEKELCELRKQLQRIQGVHNRFYDKWESKLCRTEHGMLIKEVVLKCQKEKNPKLDLSKNRLNDQEVMGLSAILRDDNVIRELDLSENKIGCDGAKGLSAMLMENTTLTVLKLGQNHVGNEGARALKEALMRNKTLKELYLTDNRISSDGASALSQSLEFNRSLVALCLLKNKIGKIGALSLVDGMRYNLHLRKIGFGYFKLGKKDMENLVKVLMRHSLKVLKLHKCELGDDGVEMLSAFMKTNTTLQKLDLEGNKIGYKGAAALCKALEENTTLQQLGMKDNAIGNVGARDFVPMLKVNTRISELVLANNDIRGDSKTQVTDAWGKRRGELSI